MIGVYTHGQETIPGLPYDLFYTLNLPIQPFRKDVDVDKDIVQTIDWYRPYRQWILDTDSIISKDYQEFTKDLGLKIISGCLLFGLQEGHAGYRHRDVHPNIYWHWDDKYNSAAINYLLTPTAGQLDFWDMYEGGDVIDTESNTQYESGIEHDNTNIITTWNGQDNHAPVLIRTEAVHQASNLKGPGPRVTLTIRFQLNPIWWMVREAYRPYFINGY